MTNYALRVAVAGGAFLGIELWRRYKGKASYDRFLEERANPLSTQRISIEQYAEEKKKAFGAEDRLLSVNSFSLANLEGVPAPRNR